MTNKEYEHCRTSLPGRTSGSRVRRGKRRRLLVVAQQPHSMMNIHLLRSIPLLPCTAQLRNLHTRTSRHFFTHHETQRSNTTEVRRCRAKHINHVIASVNIQSCSLRCGARELTSLQFSSGSDCLNFKSSLSSVSSSFPVVSHHLTRSSSCIATHTHQAQAHTLFTDSFTCNNYPPAQQCIKPCASNLEENQSFEEREGSLSTCRIEDPISLYYWPERRIKKRPP